MSLAFWLINSHYPMTDADDSRLFEILTNCQLMYQLHGRDRA